MAAINLDRRQLLKGLGAGALAAGAAATLPATVLADSEEHGAAGAWTIMVHPTARPTRQATASFGPGGIFSVTDSLAPGAVGVGVWKHLEASKFALKFTVYDFSHGAPGVAVSITGSGSVSGDTMQGTFQARVFGSVVDHGSISGTRMTV